MLEISARRSDGVESGVAVIHRVVSGGDDALRRDVHGGSDVLHSEAQLSILRLDELHALSQLAVLRVDLAFEGRDVFGNSLVMLLDA